MRDKGGEEKQRAEIEGRDMEIDRGEAEERRDGGEKEERHGREPEGKRQKVETKDQR